MGPKILEGDNYKNKKYYNKKEKQKFGPRVWPSPLGPHLDPSQVEDIQTQMKESQLYFVYTLGASQFLANYITLHFYFVSQPCSRTYIQTLFSDAALILRN